MASALTLACTVFPAGTLSRQECDYRESRGTQHPEVLPHVAVPPITDPCSEARTGMRWSEMPCGTEAVKEQPAKNATIPQEKKQ